MDYERSIRSDEQLVMHVVVNDPDRDRLRIEAVGAPAGMRIVGNEVQPGKVDVELVWRPRGGDTGRHELTLTASDGQSTITKTIAIRVEEEWQSYLLPGLQYSAYVPSAHDTWGAFQGVSAEILVASWIHRNENRGPSHGRVYVDMDVLKSSNASLGAAFDFSLGFDLSIERDPMRRYLVPYFGVMAGRVLQADLPNSGFTHVTPLLGVYLYADRNVFVHGSLGYVLPISAQTFDTLRGVRGVLGVDFSLW